MSQNRCTIEATIEVGGDISLPQLTAAFALALDSDAIKELGYSFVDNIEVQFIENTKDRES